MRCEYSFSQRIYDHPCSSMKLSVWAQKFFLSLTAMTWMGFLVVCAIFGGYAFFLKDKELSIQHSELEYLREKNQALTEWNRELEQQLTSIQSENEDAPGINGVAAELEEGSQRSFRYTVKKGDTIWDIAEIYNIDVKALMRWNNLTPRSRIFPGDQLIIIIEE
jgi:cell division protein FtsB